MRYRVEQRSIARVWSFAVIRQTGDGTYRSLVAHKLTATFSRHSKICIYIHFFFLPQSVLRAGGRWAGMTRAKFSTLSQRISYSAHAMHSAGRGACIWHRAPSLIPALDLERLKFNVIYYFLIYPMKTFYADIFDARIPPALPERPTGRSLEGGGRRVRLTPRELKRVLTR